SWPLTCTATTIRSQDSGRSVDKTAHKENKKWWMRRARAYEAHCGCSRSRHVYGRNLWSYDVLVVACYCYKASLLACTTTSFILKSCGTRVVFRRNFRATTVVMWWFRPGYDVIN